MNALSSLALFYPSQAKSLLGRLNPNDSIMLTRTALPVSSDKFSTRFGLRKTPWQSPLDQIYGPSSLVASAPNLVQYRKELSQRVQTVADNQKSRYKVIADLTEVLDQYIQGKWTEETQPGRKRLLETSLKKLMGPRGQGNIVMAQFNPKACDLGRNISRDKDKAVLAGNGIQMMKYIKQAETIGADVVVFPELSLMGYPVRDVIMRYPGIVTEQMKWLKQLAKETGETAAIVGFVEPRVPKKGEKLIGRPYYNSLAILQHGEIKGVVRKTLLPNYNEFDDWRTFEASPAPGVHSPKTLGSASWGFVQTPQGWVKGAPQGSTFNIHGKNYGFTVCEDIWNDQDYFNSLLYTADPVRDVASHKPDAMINISSSPTRSNKEQLKDNMLRHVSSKYNMPVVYVNQVGAIDENSFEGASRVYGKRGQLLARAKSFNPQFMVTNPFGPVGKTYRLTEDINRPYSSEIRFDPFDTRDLERTYYSLVQGIRDYFGKRGFTQKALLGLSGGLDSAVTAVLLADALGPENVIGIRMSSHGITSSESEIDAKQLAEALDIGLIDMPITEPFEGFKKLLKNVEGYVDMFWGRPSGEDATEDNVQARSRAINIWAIANRYKGVAIATCDKSEVYLGYTTIGGDMLGELAPISDVPKEKVRSLARWMNQHRSQKNAIPVRTIEKPSGAELRRDEKGRIITAERARMPYPFMDEAIYRYEARHQTKEDMLKGDFWFEREGTAWTTKNNMDWLDEFRPFSKSNPKWMKLKKKWLDDFFFYDHISQIKRKLGAPAIIVSDYGITKDEYRRPITTDQLGRDRRSPAKIRAMLQSV